MGEPDDGPVTCSHCGVTEVPRPLTWSLDVGPRGARWICAACTRANVRSIEGKLDETYW